MKKVLFMAIAALAMISCSDDSTSGQGTGGQGSQPKTEPATQVYIQGNKTAATRAAAAKVNKKGAYFFIRLDNRIAGAEDCKSGDYFPQDAFGNTVRLPYNKGYIDADYAYYSSNDDYDKYVYDSKGKATLDAIVEQPQLKSIIKANLNPKLKLKDIDIEDLYVIWYMVKKQKDGWHVDGVLTKKTNKDLSEIPGVGGDIKEENKDLTDKKDDNTVPATGDGNVEVDIHQQAHKDWSEIKTSIHVRDEAAKKVVVEIPLAKENVAEQDDVAIRTWDLKIDAKVYIKGTEYELGTTNPVQVIVEHLADKVVITADCTSATEYIQALRKEYGDGVTIEVHTYGKGLTDAQVWEKVKKSTVRVEPSGYKHLKYNGATSAYFGK